MRECPRCETCYEDDVETCPQDQANTKHTLPGPRCLTLSAPKASRPWSYGLGLSRSRSKPDHPARRDPNCRPDILNDEDLQEGEAIARFEREARAAASNSPPQCC